MTPLAVLFLVLSWGFVLGLTFWAFRRVLTVSEQRRSGIRREGDDADET